MAEAKVDGAVVAAAPAPVVAAAPWSALVVGGTGQTGRQVIKQLTSSPEVSKVTAMVRKELPADQVKAKFDLTEDEQKKLTQVVVNFDDLEKSKDAFKGHEKGFCLLGTTRNQAGSAEAFRKVDYDYVLNTAKLMAEAGVQHYSLLTSQGSDKNSMFLYPRTKGEVEEACRALGFPRFSIFRPGMLLTDREESRPMEWFFQRAWPNFMLPENWKATPTSLVARAIVTNALRPVSPKATRGVEEYTTSDIRLLKVGVFEDPNAKTSAASRMCVSK